ncbi:hypothetical protein E0Z10_g8069 [Xylaria hypoxylon]|uniref:Glycine zipper 2TM domain-containing protein n=1 Tax=Xylaria hypoxylon TaxID=37992 RepID=A0A4Z0Y964_9PEZI|nr:hypothetical protein E0Z10_g8069 [Xylaria hypoxylon]
MSRYEDGYPSRGRAADYYTYSAGEAAATPPPYPHTASPGHTTYNGQPQARLTYEPQGTYYPPRSPSAGLHASDLRSRPRSLAPPVDSPHDRTRGRRNSNHSDDSETRSPIGKAKRFVDSTFTDSTTGLGVGVLGALVGGLAAREAVELTSNREKGHNDDAERKRNQLIGTMVGAAVGALGANAVEKRIEVRRARDDIKQEKWERKWRRPDGDVEVIEKMEVGVRPRSRAHSPGSRNKDDRDAWHGRDRDRGGRSSSRRGLEREVDPEARSWRNVEDWLLEDGHGDDSRSRSGRHRSRDSYRH